MSQVSSSTGLCRLSKDEGPGASQSATGWKRVCWSESFPSTGLLVGMEEARKGPGGNQETHKISAGLNVSERKLASST